MRKLQMHFHFFVAMVIIGLYVVFNDISQRVRVEDALKESEDRYRDLVESASDLIQSVTPDGRFVFVNRAWRETLGYTEDEVAGLAMFDVIAPADHAHCREILQRAMSRESIEPVEAIFVTKKGLRIPVEGSVSCRFVDNKPVATRGIFRDITARKTVERMKEEFLSAVSHELRTPLTAIRGSLGLITGGATGELPPKTKVMADIAYTNSERLLRLINDLLDIEKIEAGRLSLRLEPLDLVALVAQAIEANQAYGQQFGVGFVLERAAPEAWVLADGDRLMQVLANLLSNAAKFSPPDQVVTIGVIRQDRLVRVAIIDRGPGIPEEFRARIFQKFAQADSSGTRQKGGTGLGLSISKAIVEKLGGHIGYTTEIDVGTTFYFDLPAWHADGDADR